MTRIWNPYVFTPLGNPIVGEAPPVLRVMGGMQATAQQLSYAQQRFTQFVMQARLSTVPNPTEAGSLPDGTQYRIVKVGPQTTMEIWPGGGDGELANSGIVFSAHGGKRWLLVNRPTRAGGASAKWELRDITLDYPLELVDLGRLFNSRLPTIRIAGRWKYSYNTYSMGRYGRPDIYGISPYFAHVTPSGVVLAVKFRIIGRYFDQYAVNKNIQQLPPPPYGSKPSEQIPPEEVSVTASVVDLGEGTQSINLQAPIEFGMYGDGFYFSSVEGRYIAVATERKTGVRGTLLGPLLGAPDRYEIRAHLWPKLLSVAGAGLYSRPSLLWASIQYDEVEQVARVFSASDTGYVPHSSTSLGVVEESVTPTEANVNLASSTYPNVRFGIRVSDQVWPDPHRISSFLADTSTSPYYVKLTYNAVHSETYRYNISKEQHRKERFVEGVSSGGVPMTYTVEEDRTYLHRHSRPTVIAASSKLTVDAEGYEPPTIDVDVLAGTLSTYTQDFTFKSEITYRAQTTMKFSDLDVVTYKATIDAEFSGGGSSYISTPDIADPDRSSFNGTTTYQSRVENRRVLFRDAGMNVTVFSEVITTLSHVSSEVINHAGSTETPSTELPVLVAAKIWVCHRGKRVSIDVADSMPGNYEAGYVNLGVATDRLGNRIRVFDSYPITTISEPIGRWSPDTARPRYGSDFIYGHHSALADVVSNSGTGHSVASAKCPETGGILIAVAGRRFLVDDVGGLRDAEAVIDWPAGLLDKRFATF